MTERYRAFLEDLAEISVKHGVTICPSHHDTLQVWDISTPDEVKQYQHTEDYTMPKELTPKPE